jgi:putative MATE family efflux protein
MFSNAQLRKLIIPLLFEQLFVMLVGMLDTVMVSSAGEAAVSGVSIVNELNFLVITILAALAAGGACIVSQYLGNQEKDKANLSASQLLTVSLLISTGFMLVNLIFCNNILEFLYGGVSADVMDACRTYFWITALSFPFLGLYNCAAAVYRSMNETRVTMAVSVLMNIINIIGNYIGVFVLHMGVAGVAWPTLLSRMVAALILCSMSFNPERLVSIAWKNILTWNTDVIRRILGIAIPSAIENGLFQFGHVIMMVFISSYGTSQIAAYGVADNLSALAIVSGSAMTLSIVTVIGQCVGAKDYMQAEYYMKKMLKIAVVASSINCLIVWLLMPSMLEMYNLSAETAAIVEQLMFWYCMMCSVLEPISFVLPSGLRAAGDAKYTMYVGAASMFGIRIVFAYLFGTVFHLYVLGTFYAMFLDWIVRIIFFAMRYKSGKWKNYRAI